MTSPAAPKYQPDLSRAVELVMQLMAIAGKSGEEADVAQFVVRRLCDAGLPEDRIRFDDAHRRTLLAGQVGNLIIQLPGTHPGPRRMFSAHLDTVPICVGSRPQREGNMITSAGSRTGLGADNRAGVAVLLSTLMEILDKRLPHPPLTFCFFVQEEVGLQGSRYVSTELLGEPALAFNWDGGSPAKLTVGATGGYRLDIQVHGVASHAGGAPEWGVSAIAIASLAIADLYRQGWHGDVRRDGGHGTSNVGVIRGGDATNVVPDFVTVRAEARSHDPNFRQRIVEHIEHAFRQAVQEVRNVAGTEGSIEMDGRLDYESFRLADDEPCVLAAEAAVRAIGRQPERAIANGGVDANWTTAHGIPTVTLGCGQLNQHMVSEALAIDDFQDACRLALLLATAGEA